MRIRLSDFSLSRKDIAHSAHTFHAEHTSMAESTKGDEPPAADAQESSLVDDDQLWKDVTPIPQDDAERPMVQIAYEPEYRKAMNLFRGILKKDERSERALKLTTLILQYNPGHYTVWYFGLLLPPVTFSLLSPGTYSLDLQELSIPNPQTFASV